MMGRFIETCWGEALQGDEKASAEVCHCKFTLSLDWLNFFFFLVLALKPRTLCILGKPSITQVHTPALELGLAHCSH